MTPDQDTHRQNAAQRQAIIGEVVATHAGAPIDEIIELLRAEGCGGAPRCGYPLPTRRYGAG